VLVLLGFARDDDRGASFGVNMPTLSKTLAILGAILIVVGLPVVGHLARQKGANRCALDGVAIEPIYRVRIRSESPGDNHNASYEFCCIKCAQLWLAAHDSKPFAVFVTDETTGQEIQSGQAYFAASSVITRPTTGNRIHAFAQKSDAQKHAENFLGRVLEGKDRPFHELE
jgi:hypothetical protein